MARNDPPGVERLAERDKACDPRSSSILAQARRHQLTAAALIGGAAATAGAVYAVRQARLRRERGPVNEIMATAITASDMKPDDTAEPPVLVEPHVNGEPPVVANVRG